MILDWLSPSDWNWTAVGTLAVAGFTGVLGWQTRQLAVQSTKDVQAQWTPVILAQQAERKLIPGTTVKTVGIPVLNAMQSVLYVPIRNVGRGPALQARGTFQHTHDETAEKVASKMLSVAPGDAASLEFRNITSEKLPLDGTWTVVVDYEDLSGGKHQSVVMVSNERDRGLRIDYSSYFRYRPLLPRRFRIKWWFISHLVYPKSIRTRVWALISKSELPNDMTR